MKRYDVKSFPALAGVVLFASAIAVTTGCVERRVQDVPVYHAQTVYQPQQEPGQQTLYRPQPGAAQPPAANWQTPEPVPAYTNAPPQPTVAVVAQAPPPPQVEVVPVAPGPDYYWVPGLVLARSTLDMDWRQVDDPSLARRNLGARWLGKRPGWLALAWWALAVRIIAPQDLVAG